MHFLSSIAAVSLPVASLERAVRFYERLGFARSTHKGRDGEAFFRLDNLVLTLVPRLAAHGGFDEREALPVLSSGGAGPVQYYASALELDAAVAAAQIAGARAAVGFRSSFETFKVAFVDDPDGNQWELRFDSSLKLKNGALVLPD